MQHKEVRFHKIIEEHSRTLRGLPNVNIKWPHEPAVGNAKEFLKIAYFVSSIPLTYIMLIDSEYFFSNHESYYSQLWNGDVEPNDLWSQFQKSEILWSHVSDMKQKLISGPGRVDQFVGAPSQYTKIVGSIPGQST